MKACLLLLCFCLAALQSAQADIEIRISVKFIHGPGLIPPTFQPAPGNVDISTPAAFDTEIVHANAVLAATGRGYRLRVVETQVILPPVPTGVPVTVSGGLTMGSATVMCSNTAGLEYSMRVQGVGMPANAVITSIAPNFFFTINANATTTNNSAAITASYPADHWYNLPARSMRSAFEAAALASDISRILWAWNPNAINIYVNNTTSGQCSFPGEGDSIALGATLGRQGTVLHEIGHLYNLAHTHDGPDTVCATYVPPANLANGLGEGDGLAETAMDHDCYSLDQLSTAHFGGNYATLTQAQKDFVNTAWRNVMSYHVEEQLLDDQMDNLTFWANTSRSWSVDGLTWFVAVNGNDQVLGLYAPAPLASLGAAFLRVRGTSHVVLLRSGFYFAPENLATGDRTLNTPCTLRATRGPVTIF